MSLGNYIDKVLKMGKERFSRKVHICYMLLGMLVLHDLIVICIYHTLVFLWYWLDYKEIMPELYTFLYLKML